MRQEQRSITDNSINNAIQQGQSLDCKNTSIYTNQNIKVVLSNDSKTVITVNKNMRNTKFQLSERTQERVASLNYKISEHKNSHAMCELAELYLTGELGEKDVKKAFDLFERAAKMGSSYAMCKISEMYVTDAFGGPDFEMSYKWMKKAADRNNSHAVSTVGQKLLGEYLAKYPKDSKVFRPSGPKKKMEEEILYYLHKGADIGASSAIWQLGNIYEEGLLGEKNLSKAIELYVKGAKTGSPASLEYLHRMAEESIFSATELEEILDSLWHMTSTSIGMAFQLGVKQLNLNLGRNPIRGLNMIEQVALKQYDEAMLKIAECYRDGKMCKVNLKLAQYWFNKLHDLYEESAKAGNVMSLRKLAELYLNGDVGNFDLEKAASCFKESIEKSSNPNPQWIYDLGLLYLKGRLGDHPIEIGTKLIAQALKKWQLVAESGQSRCYDLARKYFRIIHDEKKAMFWLSKDSSNSISAKLLLVEIYLSNLSLEKNVSLGLNILETVLLEQGFPPILAFNVFNFPMYDQTVSWLQGIAGDVVSPVPDKSSNLYRCQKVAVSVLAETYEEGNLNGIIDFSLASKYYHQLFVNFESVKARNKLVSFYIRQQLPAEYHDTVKNWVLQAPALFKKSIETGEISWEAFKYFVWLLGKMYQRGDVLPHNVQEAAKWLYLSLYHNVNSPAITNRIEEDLEKLPLLDSNQKAQIVSELSEMTKLLKTTSPLIYKVMSRILGSIFYDSKIVDQDINEAIYWYTESASKNNGLAAFTLGKIYQNDKQDIDTSIKWYMLSLQLGRKAALNVLREIILEKEDGSLRSFLDRYECPPRVEKSEWEKLSPLKYLEVYPRTKKEMLELGKSYLEPGSKYDILSAAYWFRTAMTDPRTTKGSIKAGIELYTMYKSGILGNNLIPCAGSLYPDIVKKCHLKLKTSIVFPNENILETVPLLNTVSSVLKLSESTTASLLDEKLEILINQNDNINPENVADIISGLEAFIRELFSKSTISQAIDAHLLAEEVSGS